MKQCTNQRSQAFKKSAVASAISTALLLNTHLWAAEQSESEEQSDSKVITVTANRRAQSIQSVPYNISAVSGESLSEAQITDAAELMRNIPGIAVVDRGHRNSGVINGIMIRGMNVDGAALGDYALSAVPTVSTYVNETPIYANFILKDIERVEVLRGPQGTLYGSGSLGGTVRYILNRPEVGDFSAKVTTALSSTEGAGDLSWDTDFILNLPVSENIAMRFVGGKVDYSGITDYVNVYQLDENRIPVAPDGILSDSLVFESVEDADFVEIEHARVSVFFEPTDSFSALLTYQTQTDSIGGRRQQTKGSNGYGEVYGEYENGSIMLEPSNREVDLTSLEMEVDLGFATLTSSTSQYDHKGDSISENTGFYAQNNWLAAFYYNYPRPMAEATRTYSDEALVQELRLVSNGDNKLDYVVGVYYQDQDLGATQYSYLRGFQNWTDTAWGAGYVVSDNDFAYVRNQNFTELSFFGELTYHFSDELRFTFGGRNFHNEFINETDMSVGLYTSFSIQDSAYFEDEESGSLFKANFSLDLDENKMLYGTISEGYRRGGANAVPLSGTFAEDAAWQLYDSDSNINYELGLKGSLNSTRYNVSLFLVDWEDIQLNTATSNWGFFAAQNGGSAQTSGIEVEIDGYFGENNAWHYGVGYANVSAELTENFYAPTDTTQSSPISLDGAKLPGTPENTLNVSLSHTNTLSNGWYWTNRMGLYYQSETENALSDSERFNQTMDSFSIVDFSSSVASDNWVATLWIKNLTNEEGSTGVFKEEYMGTSPAQNYYGNGSKEFLALPRTIGFSLSYEF
ncbi:TonB-dependent receptor [Aliikangiella sp. G2MR2-5]|uniref:TonB-dependent receptor n=1 Tax=Aliikangiella sp. G2MR2-5 TaxID=2788943 RepID=UPI0018A9D5C9|nr:TonB-dependent receptor [Aliikangiella sp. G2MR2-5]